VISGRTAEQAMSRRAEADAADAEAARVTTMLKALACTDPRRERVRRQAITAWAPLARRLARRYAPRPGTVDDIEQTAMIGLIKAVDRFDPDRGVDFVAYAIPTILGELKRYFRDHGWMIRLPRRLHDLHLKITEANARLTQTLGRPPTITDIAHDLRLSEEETIEGLEGGSAHQPASLSIPISADNDQELGDTVGADDYGYEFTEWHIDLRAAVADLTEREKRLLSLRFYGDLTQAEIADEMGLSQMYISRLLAATIAKLRVGLLPAASLV
jgi:RNA polymerase sigma-B factor